MRTELTWGQFTLAFNVCHREVRVQLYWPYVRLRRFKNWCYTEFMIRADTNIRLFKEVGYVGAGFNLLGFGIAADCEKKQP